MRFRLRAGIALAATSLFVTAGAQATTSVSSFAQGWVQSTGASDGASNGNNTFTGNETFDRFNSWAAFNIPVGHYGHAQLDVRPLIFPLGNPSIYLIQIYDVNTPYSAFSSISPGVAVYTDLRSGVLYGGANMSNSPVNVALSSAAVSDINAASGSIFIVGFTKRP